MFWVLSIVIKLVMLFIANGIYQNMRCFINHIFACSTTYDHMKTTKYTQPILSMIQLWQYSMLLLRANCPKLNIALNIERHNDLNPIVVPTDKTDLTHLSLGTSVWYFEYKCSSCFSAWYLQATSHHLNQCWSTSISPYDVTNPQWVKAMA